MRKLGKFNILKSKSKYKDLNRYLDAVYRANKEFIDNRILTESELELASNREILEKQSKKTLFKNYIKEYMDEGYTVDQAIKKASYSRVFTEYVDLAHENLLQGLKEDKKYYKKFRELTKVNGRYTKIDMNKFTYIGNNEYSYGNIIISFSNSPKRVVFKKV